MTWQRVTSDSWRRRMSTKSEAGGQVHSHDVRTLLSTSREGGGSSFLTTGWQQTTPPPSRCGEGGREGGRPSSCLSVCVYISAPLCHANLESARSPQSYLTFHCISIFQPPPSLPPPFLPPPPSFLPPTNPSNTLPPPPPAPSQLRFTFHLTRNANGEPINKYLYYTFNQ